MSEHILNIFVASKDNSTASTISSIGTGEFIAYIILAVFGLFYILYNQVAVPQALRHLPHVPFWKKALSVIRREHPDFTQKILYRSLYEEQGLLVNIKLGSWTVSVANPEYAKQMLMSSKFPKAKMFRDDDNRLMARFIGTNNFGLQNGADWRRHREIVSPAFRRSMPVKLFGSQAQKLIKLIEANGNKINARDYLQRFSLDVIGQAALGFDFKSMDDGENSWTTMYNKLMVGAVHPLFIVFPILDKYFLWAFPNQRKLHKDMDKLDQLFSEILEGKKRLYEQENYQSMVEDNEKDLLTLMIEANLTDKVGGLSDLELRSNLSAVFIAGQDTTSTAMTTTLYHLAVHKDIQRRAREEVLAILGDAPLDVLPDIDQLKALKYIDQILKENLRACPPTPVTFPRITTADVVMGPHHIPKGTLFSLDIYAMHHSPANWTDPDRFDPERFAPGGENELKMNTENGSYAWSAFSNGIRKCKGMNFTLTQQKLVMSMLLRKYEWSLPADSIHKDGLVFTPASEEVMVPLNVIIDFHPRY